jgi:hypothetical protein
MQSSTDALGNKLVDAARILAEAMVPQSSNGIDELRQAISNQQAQLQEIRSENARRHEENARRHDEILDMMSQIIRATRRN